MIKKIPSKRSRRKTRVAAYVRVSTGLTTQEDSYEAQRDYYESVIQSTSGWKFAGVYGDKQSGTSTRNRPEFKRMLEDARDGHIDLILCKSISRWGRNTADALDAVRELSGRGIGVIFEQESIDTRDVNQIMKLNLVAAIAQSESETISENLKWVYRQRARMGIRIPNRDQHFGYDTSGHTYKPDENADVVREIFQKYADGETMSEIARELKGKRTNRGNPWSYASVKCILMNEVYVGDVKFGKCSSRNIITGEVDELQAEGYLCNHHEGLVDRETWDKVQDRLSLKRRGRQKMKRPEQPCNSLRDDMPTPGQ